MLSGKAHFEDPEAMERQLTAEGIEILNDQIQQFSTVFWDPEKELGL
jgi:methylated-DNA-protein-cysteine methyltransferase-like protein